MIFHIDMNSFFASCEQVVHPELRGKAIIVGGDPERRSGIVLAASYEAKKKGVKTTMPLQQALRFCPEAIVVQTTFGLYSKLSKEVMAIFDQYTPLKEQASIDEAFLDMTGTEHLFGPPKEAAKRIQDHILKELELPCSVGISTNKLLAKMASEMKKPLGITTLFESEIREKLWPLPVGELYGIGRKTSPKLEEIGIRTIGDLARASREELITRFGNSMASYMKDAANGIGSDLICNEEENPKSIGNEVTFSDDLTECEVVKHELLLLADRVAYRARRHKQKGKTVSIKLKYSDFRVITRARTMKARTDDSNQIYQTACDLLKEYYHGEPIRLLGLTLSHFEDSMSGQLSLFDEEQVEATNKVDQVMDSIREKFGYQAITRASTLENQKDKK